MYKDDTAAESLAGARPWELDGHDLAETERLLARLDLAPSRADGIIDHKTQAASRLYQEIAACPSTASPRGRFWPTCARWSRFSITAVEPP